MTDNDDLREYDLEAWEVPAPHAGLADAVIARAREAAPVAAVEPEPMRARRFWLAGGAGVLVAAAAIGSVLALGARHAAPVQGSVLAERAQRLDLDSVSAELDSGADVRWARHGDTLAVEQPRGNATWRVGDEHLQITSAGTTIDASGASLRVEVHMQLSDARLLGASTLTAAAVAFVTIVVYEGHVGVHSAGQTVNVEPGATVEVRPGQPPAPPVLVGGDQTEKLQKRIDELQNKLDQLQGQNHAGAGLLAPSPPPPPQPPGDCDEVSCVLENYEPLCCAKFKHSAAGGDALDRAKISDGIAKIKDRVVACGNDHPAKGVLKAHIKVAPDGSVSDVAITQTPSADLSPCVVTALRAATFAPTKAGGSFSYPFVFDHAAPFDPFESRHGAATVTPTPPPPATCDADKLDEAARNEAAMGQHVPALRYIEEAIACKPTIHRYQVAFMSACNSANAAKAKLYFPRLGPSATSLSQMCARNGISLESLQEGGAGYIQIASKPSAKVLVDGVDTGLWTPVAGTNLPLAAGKHKITFEIGVDKYTYPVMIQPGKVTTLSKDLQ